MFICGTGNFPDDDAKLSRRPNKNQNPYADRGLDKFYALLADLDDKKQKIYTRLGSEDISFVRFVYANDDSNHVKPIVVKVKDKTHENANTRKNNDSLIKPINRITTNENKNEIVPEKEETEEACKKMKKKYMIRCNAETISFSWINRLKQPCWYFVAALVLIMVLLAVFGRSFAILCTSIGWYLVPTVVGEGSSSASSSVERKPKRKKEYVKKLTSNLNNQSSSVSAINGLPNNRKVQKVQHGQKKKLLKVSTF